MKKKLSIKITLTLALFTLLLGMPAGALPDGGGNPVDVHAQDRDGEEEAEKSSGTKAEENGKETKAEREDEASGKISEPECVCARKCSPYAPDQQCGVCREDYSRCRYDEPEVKITIATPLGWHKETAKVSVSAEDVAHSGNFTIKTVQAKIAQNGSWTDITEDMYVEISENSTVYVLVTDQNGNTYEKNRYIKCFDFTKPVLNAAVSDGLLSVQAQDTDSGIKAVYVNGYEFKKLTQGVLNIRLQQFDAGYQYFTISAMDNAGNMSEIYKTENPYYTNPEEDGNGENPAEQLPVNAQASGPSSAAAQVTEHTRTDSSGNTVSEDSPVQKKQETAETGEKEESGEKEKSGEGKEFYTIQTATEKVFYLIIDRDGEEEAVYFLTEISENDLLNAASDVSETLPKNSAALESAIPVTESALSNNSAEDVEPDRGQEADPEEDAGESAGNAEMQENVETSKDGETAENPAAAYLILGVLAAGVIGAVYYFQAARRKNGEFLDEDEEEEEEGEEYEEEEEEETEPDFFGDKEDSVE